MSVTDRDPERIADAHGVLDNLFLASGGASIVKEITVICNNAHARPRRGFTVLSCGPASRGALGSAAAGRNQSIIIASNNDPRHRALPSPRPICAPPRRDRKHNGVWGVVRLPRAASRYGTYRDRHHPGGRLINGRVSD